MAYLIVGLGNPGDEYAETRHNFGFRVVEELAAGISAAKEKTRANAEAWSGKIGGAGVHIIEPQTFMNLSGEAVVPFMKSKKIEAASLVAVHDDLDIPFGDVRISRNASSGGHNGVQSIIDSLGTQDFTRVRLGIGRPPENVPAEKFVLQRFTSEEKKRLSEIIEKAIEMIGRLITTRQY